jgi:hypothetical protein
MPSAAAPAKSKAAIRSIRANNHRFLPPPPPPPLAGRSPIGTAEEESKQEGKEANEEDTSNSQLLPVPALQAWPWYPTRWHGDSQTKRNQIEMAANSEQSQDLRTDEPLGPR